MKRLFAAALAASTLLAPAALCAIRGYQFAPAYRQETPKVPEPVVGSYEGIHTIAIVSTIGTRFDLERRGPTGKKLGSLDISAWKLDDRIEATVRNAVPGPFTFISVDRAKLANGPFDVFLKSLPTKGIDAFIVVRPNTIGGIALQSVEYHDTILWVDFEIDVIDARSLKVIAKSTARVQPPSASHPNFPGLVLGKEFALDGALTISPEVQEKLHILTNEMLAVTMTETLRSLKLAASR